MDAGSSARACIPTVVVSVSIALTNWQNLWQRELTVVTQEPPRLIAEQFGLAHVLWIAWVVLITVPLVYFFLITAYRETDSTLVRRQIVVFALGMAIPFGVTILFVTGITATDFTPVGFGALSALFTAAVTRYRALDVVPIARDSVFENMDAGVVVLNTEDRIVDINDQGRAIVGERADSLLGAPVSEAFAEFETVLETIETVTDDTRTIALDDENDQTRHYQLTVSPIQRTDDRRYGRVIIFSEITDQIERQRQLAHQNEELEAKNERLDEFTNIVAHDLQSPLNTAIARLKLARREHESEHFPDIAQAHERMDSLIDDLLATARHGRSDTETVEVSLATAAQTAWGTVETREATLVTATDQQIIADKTQLQQLFKNLFMNAIEHGGESVTVTVGDMDAEDGFYVEDDGAGIPEEDQAAVFDRGYTTTTNGVGLGLYIVQKTAEAHGWEIGVTDGADGGARFECTDVTVAE